MSIPTALYPEMAAGGYSRVDGTVAFYTRVNALLRPDMMVLDFGAGRGWGAEDPVPYRRSLRTLRGKVARVVGVDVDDAVLGNPLLDERLVIPPGERLPLPDGTVDLILADWVFEHLPDPVATAVELARVLRPGGWLCARTTNRWGYVAVAARLIPDRLHDAVLRRAQPNRRDEDVFPAYYRANTAPALARCFPDRLWARHVWAVDSEPHYCGGSPALGRAVLALQAITPPAVRRTLFAFLRRR